MIPDEASLNLKTGLATVTAAPDSTAVAVSVMSEDTFSIRITSHSLRCTMNTCGAYLYQSAIYYPR